MKPVQEHAETDTVETPRDFSLEGACLLCGGDLQVRVGAGRAATFCPACRWISHPHMKRSDEGSVHVIHPAGLVA
jgi:hypothetical protein